ncbi:MAG: hypothetical protein N3A65_09385, partial [candidate division WOR-3 bacterium]|nr:hypothetical protein [candidate division WOR-3 bacterium]
MFLWLFFLITDNVNSDTIHLDSVKIVRYERPKIINFCTAGVLDSILNQTQVIEPIIFLSGFFDIFYNSNYLLRE